VFQQTRETVDESNTAIGAKPMAVPCGAEVVRISQLGYNCGNTHPLRIHFVIPELPPEKGFYY